MQPEAVAEAGESVWCQHSLECHVVDWQLDAVKTARTDVGNLVCSSLESDGGFHVPDVGVLKPGVVAPGTTRLGQD